MRKVSDNPKDTHRYDDMLEMEPPSSMNHRPMPPEKRAAQFAPFAALTGYEEAITRSGQIKPQRKEFDEDMVQKNNETLQYLRLYPNQSITIKYYDHDEEKILSSSMYTIDEVHREIIIDKKIHISFIDIIEINVGE